MWSSLWRSSTRPASHLRGCARSWECTTGSCSTWYAFSFYRNSLGVGFQLTVNSQSVPGVHITKTTGPSRDRNWGLDTLGDFLQDIDVRVRKASRDAKLATSSDLEETTEDGSTLLDESTTLEQSIGSVGDSVVIVDANEA